MTILRIFAALAITAASVSACTVPGTPSSTTVDLSTLDGGPYSFELLSEPPSGNEGFGRIVESTRMVEALTDPVEVDPALKESMTGIGARPLSTPVKATAYLAAPARPVLERYGMVGGAVVSNADGAIEGFATVGQGRVRLLSMVLLRFPDSGSAQQAAQEIDAVDAAVSAENVAVAIPEHPGAHAHWRPTVPTLAATIAVDEFVASLIVAHTGPDLAALTDLARKAFNDQVPRLRGFTPTPLDQIAGLALDRDGMLARMLPEMPGRWRYPAVTFVDLDGNAGWGPAMMLSGIVFGPRGAAMGMRRPDVEPPEQLAIGTSTFLARFSSPAVARKYFAAFDPSAKNRRVDGAPGIPDTRCIEFADSKGSGWGTQCWVLHGRYFARVFAGNAVDARLRVTAQYALLTKGD